jgi:hypothetical protein
VERLAERLLLPDLERLRDRDLLLERLLAADLADLQ